MGTYVSVRNSSTLPTIVIDARRANLRHVTNLKKLLIYTAHLAQAFYDFYFIVLRFASSFFVLSKAELSVVLCFNSPCLLFAVGFYSHEQWLCLFGSFEPWLARPTCIYGFGDDLFYAYSCCMSVQFFDRLFTSGPMHSEQAVMHCFGNLAFSRLHPVT